MVAWYYVRQVLSSPSLLSDLSCLLRGGPAFGGPGVSSRSDAALVIRFFFLLFELFNLYMAEELIGRI